MTDHEPLYLPNKDIRQGFETETKQVRLANDMVNRHLNVDKPRTTWLSPGKTKDGKPLPKTLHLEVFTRIALRHDNKSIEVGLEICDPAKVPYARTFHFRPI